ncbi:MAG: hypothetical protein LBV20_04130 [Treponema sp.]|jgi:hypothetical protein|nr:hypothetical protein [Treponema sp.]
MKNFDWLPNKRGEKLAMAEAWYNILKVKNSLWGITDDVLDELRILTDVAEKCFLKALSSDRTAMITTRCKKAFDNLITCMQNMKTRIFLSPPLVNEDFINLRLKSTPSFKTPILDPTGQASADVISIGPTLLMLSMKHLLGSKMDLRTDYGYRIFYGVLSPDSVNEENTASSSYLMKAAITGEDLPLNQFTRRKKETFIFPSEDSGKTVFFCIKLENSNGKSGPWGPMFSAVIP